MNPRPKTVLARKYDSQVKTRNTRAKTQNPAEGKDKGKGKGVAKAKITKQTTTAASSQSHTKKLRQIQKAGESSMASQNMIYSQDLTGLVSSTLNKPYMLTPSTSASQPASPPEYLTTQNLMPSSAYPHRSSASSQSTNTSEYQHVQGPVPTGVYPQGLSAGSQPGSPIQYMNPQDLFMPSSTYAYPSQHGLANLRNLGMDFYNAMPWTNNVHGGLEQGYIDNGIHFEGNPHHFQATIPNQQGWNMPGSAAWMQDNEGQSSYPSPK